MKLSAVNQRKKTVKWAAEGERHHLNEKFMARFSKPLYLAVFIATATNYLLQKKIMHCAISVAAI